MMGRRTTRQKGCSWTEIALLAFAPAALTACTATQRETVASPQVAHSFDQARCGALAGLAQGNSPVPGLTIQSVLWRDAGLVLTSPRGEKSAPLPAHCEIEGYYAEQPGIVGGPYRNGFRMRLPQVWNQRFLFQGGGGSNGIVGDATGPNGAGNPSALERGYAVIAQDSGHDNTRNNLPDHGGELVFGHDPVARANYGHASLKPTYDLGRYLIHIAYGEDPQTKLFWGCSKGGQEGMAFAQRYPDAFDGIVAMAPGFSLPRAAVAEAWDTQQFAGILSARGETPTVARLRNAFSPAQWQRVASTVLATCDGDDGAVDGMIGAFEQCTTARVEPRLRQQQCAPDGNDGACLKVAQVDALVQVMDGVRDSAGKQLYAPFAWDAGVGTPGWRVWKIGMDPAPPALNVRLGASSLAAVFTSPPTALAADPQTLLNWQLAFDFDRDAPGIYAVTSPFTTSPWQDVGMRSPDLAAFRKHGGKLIVPHGVSDPVFSVLDTIAWWREVDAKMAGHAADFARVFPVPGMNHCSGGPATDRFDSLTALEDWVIGGKAPEAIPAKAGPGTPWPGREMPLCPYPQIAVSAGGIDVYRCAASPN